MKKKHGIDFIPGIIAGIVIYIINLLVSEMIYFNITDNYFTLVFCTFILMGSAFTIITLLYKKPSIQSMIIRFLAIFISFGLILVLIGTSGLIPFMEQLLKLDTGSYTDNVSGLMSITFLIIVFFTSVITIIIRAVVNRLQNIKKYW